MMLGILLTLFTDACGLSGNIVYGYAMVFILCRVGYLVLCNCCQIYFAFLNAWGLFVNSDKAFSFFSNIFLYRFSRIYIDCVRELESFFGVMKSDSLNDTDLLSLLLADCLLNLLVFDSGLFALDVISFLTSILSWCFLEFLAISILTESAL